MSEQIATVTRIHPEYDGVKPTGKHEGDLRQAGWVEVDGGVAGEMVPMPVGRHEVGAIPTARERLGQLAIDLLAGPRVKTWR